MKKEYYVFKMNIAKLNVLACVILIFAFIVTYFIDPQLFIQSLKLFDFNNAKTAILIYICVLGYMILHELLHAVGYIIYGAKPEKITFGIELEKGVFYCLCKQDVTRKNILNASMFPLFYIGIVTYIISIIFDLPLLLLLSIINISCAAGDIMYFLYFMKLDKNIMFSELDDGTSFAILADYDVSKVKHFGVDFVEKIDEIPRKDFERIKISKFSWGCIIIISTITVLAFII